MSEFRADLHCHSTHSDGTYSVKELIVLAAELGLKGLSITDHDSTAAYPKAFELGAAHDVLIVSGTELSCVHRGHGVHILGYAFDPEHSAIQKWCQQAQNARRQRNESILRELHRINLSITEEDLLEANPQLKSTTTRGRPHIANAMVAKGYARSIQHAFKSFLIEGCPGFVGWDRGTVEEGIATIHEAGGLAVLAHPHIVKNGSIVRDMLAMPFDGIEGHYARFPLDKERRWLDEAQTRGLLLTGGSDFHGAVKPGQPLGCSWAPENTFQHIYKHMHEATES